MDKVKNISLKVAMTCHHAGGLAWDRNDERVCAVGGTLRYAENNDTYDVDIHDLEDVWSCRWRTPDAGDGYELCSKDEAEKYDVAGKKGFSGAWSYMSGWTFSGDLQYIFRRKVKQADNLCDSCTDSQGCAGNQCGPTTDCAHYESGEKAATTDDKWLAAKEALMVCAEKINAALGKDSQ